ncbi:MAG: asparaginase [Clostridia bacterium]|nr:asparaginase [Clostridia bacterium]
MKKILFIATGGTIASAETENGLSPEITGEELTSAIPEVKEICEYDCMQLCNLDSTNLGPKHWLYIVEVIRDIYNSYDGFVISHGTDTMAYTASALTYLMQNLDKPVVITGSQYPVGAENSDAHKNLRDAFTAVCDENLKGVFVVFCGFVIAGCRARKMKSMSYDGFYSINSDNVAEVRGGHLEYTEWFKTTLIKTLQTDDGDFEKAPPVFYNRLNPKVAVMKLIPGMKEDVLEYLFTKNDAVIIESFGAGGLPTSDEYDFERVIQKANDEGKFTVIATQALLDGTNLSTYEVGKKFRDELSVLETYDMTIEAALSKLMWILGQAFERKEVEKLFYTPVSGDINIKV